MRNSLLPICDTTKPPYTITKAALKISNWLFDIQQNNPFYKQRVQNIKLNELGFPEKASIVFNKNAR